MNQFESAGSVKRNRTGDMNRTAESAAHGSAGATHSQSHILQLQRTAGNTAARHMMLSGPAIQKKSNRTGMPDNLKEGIESLSGTDLSDVRVRYGSDKPGEVGAAAYAQGNEIHVAPGQERHLPHEAWHVVQQRQGRVAPTGQLANGMAVNEDEGLEREADEMGSRAMSGSVSGVGLEEDEGPEREADEACGQPVSRGAFPTVQRAVPNRAPGQQPAQFVWVKKKTSHGKVSTQSYVPALQGETGAEETATMKLSEKQAVLKDLAALGKKAAKHVQQLTLEINSITKPVTEKELLGFSAELDDLLAKKAAPAGLEDADIAKTREISFRLLRGLDYLGELDEGESDALKLRALLQVQLDKLFRLDDQAMSNARNLAETDAFTPVSGEEIGAYRQDIRSGGVWGGGAEAAVLASGVGLTLDLLFLDQDGNYVRADTIGNGPASQFSILNLGTHYVVVAAGQATGNAYNESHIVHDPDPDGNCMFNALHYALTNGNTGNSLNYQPPGGGAPITLNPDTYLEQARNIVADDMDDMDITLSIEEILISGQAAGVGPNLKRFVGFRRYGKAEVLKLAERYKVKTGDILQELKQKKIVKKESKNSLPEILDIYDKFKKKNPSDCEKLLNAILEIIFSSVEAKELIEDSPSEELERGLRKTESEKYRLLHDVVNSPNNPKQLIVTIQGNEFILDRIGQLVPRFVYRSISDFNIAELEQESSIFPSNQSPVPKSSKYSSDLKKKYSTDTSTTGSGTSDNKVEATDEMLHVEGSKPSKYLSTTKEEKGTVNPEGRSFGSSLYRIDLSFINPAYIADLSSDKGISYYMLGNYAKKKREDLDRSGLIGKAKEFNVRQETARKRKEQYKTIADKDKFDAENAAAEQPELSGKEWQALMDVLRTSEVLIKTSIPLEALENA